MSTNDENGSPSYRRQREKGDPGIIASKITATHFATSNSTVKAFLGGRQKAWMTGGNDNVAPSPRPLVNILRPSIVSPRQSSRSSRITSLANPSKALPVIQSPSNSTSPIIANSLGSSESASTRSANNETVLPSPVPSEETCPEIPVPSDQTATEVLDPTEGNFSNLGKSCDHGNGRREERDQPGCEKRLDNLNSKHRVARVEKILEFSARDSTIENPVDGGVGAGTYGSNQIPLAEASVARKRSLQACTSQGKRQRASTVVDAVSASAVGARQSPPSGSSNQSPVPNQPSNPPTVSSTITSPAQTSSQAPSLRYFLNIIDKYIASVGGELALSSVELPRLRLLQDACRSEDCFYLALHQVYCLHAITPHMIPQIGADPIYLKGLSFLGLLLLKNDLLSDSSLRWFSNFPSPIDDLLRRSTMYQGAFRDVQKFLYLLSHNWQPVQEGCRQREYPPLVDELVNLLGLTSVVFQRVVFTSIHRSLWGNEQGGTFEKVEQVFRENQQDYHRTLARMYTSSPPSTEEVKSKNEELAKRYKATRLQYLQDLERRSHASPSVQQALASAQQNLRQLPQLISRPMILPSNDHRPPSISPTNISQQLGNHSQLVIDTQAAQREACNLLPSVVDLQSDPARSLQLQRMREQQAILASMQQTRPPSVLRTQMPLSAPPSAIQGQTSASHRISLASAPAGASLPTPQQQYHHHRTASGPQPYRSPMLLIPPSGYALAPPTYPNPNFTALHQAHLQSPILSLVNLPGEPAPSGRIYQYIEGFAMVPKILGLHTPIQIRNFAVSASDCHAKAVALPSDDGRIPKRTVRAGSKIYRLRCTMVSSDGGTPAESMWVIAENVWPAHVFIDINSVNVELRRKLHYGKDLPVDVTSYVKEGLNEVKISIMRNDKEKAGINYAFAIEVIGLINHSKLRGHCIISQAQTAAQVLENIKSSLTISVDDDEITVVDSNITIDLTDPFTAHIFDIPVRGKACLHRECFDLDTFLETRKSKREGWPCLPDEWKCPRCGADARPQTLIVDGFLIDVRRQLAEQDVLSTRAIVVEKDGSWKPKAEKMQEDTSEKTGCSAAPVLADVGIGLLGLPLRTQHAVIELGDD
ncbi:MAG: hypothetical protein M1827_001360 [Pycnora praestabilis]|nr:MAG: hypothetical protein M1827_001360 [Pycnora praestabilis]